MRTEREIVTRVDDRNDEVDSFLRWLALDGGTGIVERASMTSYRNDGALAMIKIRLWGMSEIIRYNIRTSTLTRTTYELMQVLSLVEDFTIEKELALQLHEMYGTPVVVEDGPHRQE